MVSCKSKWQTNPRRKGIVTTTSDLLSSGVVRTHARRHFLDSSLFPTTLSLAFLFLFASPLLAYTSHRRRRRRHRRAFAFDGRGEKRGLSLGRRMGCFSWAGNRWVVAVVCVNLGLPAGRRQPHTGRRTHALTHTHTRPRMSALAPGVCLVVVWSGVQSNIAPRVRSKRKTQSLSPCSCGRRKTEAGREDRQTEGGDGREGGVVLHK